MALNIELLIRARDEASPVVEKAGKTVTKLHQDLGQGAEFSGRQVRDVTSTLKLLAGSIASEVNPALGAMTFALSAAGREARTLTASKALLLVGATALAAGLAQLIAAAREGAKAQTELNAAVRSLDFGGALGQLQRLKQQQEEFALFIPKSIQGILDFFRSHAVGPEGGMTMLDRLLGRADPRRIAEAEAAVAALFPLEQAKRVTDEALRYNAVLQDQRKLRGEIALVLEQELEVQGERIPLALDLLREEEKLTQQQVALTRTRVTIEASQRAAQLSAVGQTKEAAGVFAQLGLELIHLDETELLLLSRIAERARQVGITLRAVPAEREARRAVARAHLPGLSLEEQFQLDLEAIEMRRRAAVARAPTGAEQELITFEAQVERARREFARAAAIDPLTGIRQGIRETTEEFSNLGESMRRGIGEVGQAMSRSFSDTFVASVTGDFKKLEQLPQQFGLAVLRTIGDIVARAATGSIFRAFAGAFPNLAQFAGLPGGAGAGPFGSGAVLTPAGAGAAPQLSLLDLTYGGGSAAAVPSAVYAPGRGTTLGYAGGIGVPQQLGPGTAVVNGQVITSGSEFGTQATGQTVGGQAAAGGGYLAGAAIAGYAGSAIGALAAAYGVYSAYESGTQTGNITTSVLGGALSGAAFGAFFGPVGAIAGLVIGGLIGYFGAAAGQATAARRKRRVQRLQHGQRIAQDLQQAFALGDPGLIVAAPVRGNITAGGLLKRMVDLNLGGFTSGLGWPPSQVARDADAILAALGVTRGEEVNYERLNSTFEFIATLHAGRGLEVLKQNAEALLQGFIDAVKNWRSSLAATIVGYEETLPTGLLRTTFVSAALPIPAGQQLSITGETLAGLQRLPDAIKENILRQLVRLDQDLDLRIVRRDPQTGQVVSQTSFA
jgi:hypothetical protein